MVRRLGFTRSSLKTALLRAVSATALLGKPVPQGRREIPQTALQFWLHLAMTYGELQLELPCIVAHIATKTTVSCSNLLQKWRAAERPFRSFFKFFSKSDRRKSYRAILLRCGYLTTEGVLDLRNVFEAYRLSSRKWSKKTGL